MRCISTCKGWPKSISLDGSSENNSRLPLVSTGSCVCSVYFVEIMTAEIFCQRFKFFIGIVCNHCSQCFSSKQFLANNCSFSSKQPLFITINKFSKSLRKNTTGILCEQCIPRGPPKDLDDVPTCSSETTLQFLNDFRIPSYRTVQTLKVTVHRHDNVVQSFTGCKSQLGE